MRMRFANTVRRAAAIAGLSMPTFAPGAQTLESALEVTVDRASLIRSPDGVATVIIGNPLIADATTQRNGVIVITGKSFGSTNIMLLDAKGEVLSETVVNVGRGQNNTVMVQRGAKRESFACNPRCEPVLAIGDNQDTFSTTAGQISQRQGMSTSTGQ